MPGGSRRRGSPTSGSVAIVPFVAGVDSSTQSTKVEIRDLDSGEIVAAGSAPHPAVTPPVSEQDPASWWTAFESAWAEAVGALPSGSTTPEITAISVAGQQHGMVALDAADRRCIQPNSGTTPRAHPTQAGCSVNSPSALPTANASTTAHTHGLPPSAACPSPHSPPPNCRGCTDRTPTPGGAWRGCCCRTTT